MAEEKHNPSTDELDNDLNKNGTSQEDEGLTEDELNDVTGGMRGVFCREAGPIFVKQANFA